MVFVDGENFAMRYGGMLKAMGGTPRKTSGGVWCIPDVALWAQQLHVQQAHGQLTNVLRHYYFTSVQGDDAKLDEVETWLKGKRIEAPRVFKRDKNRGSKRVDISLTTEMLTHAHRKHFDVAILIAGDADYIPLVRAVQREGARVHLWALSDGLSPQLVAAIDYSVVIDEIFGVG
jgi:uncharacterized LabA/DUF88 family protein